LKQMPALAVTAFAQREDRMRALTAGFQMHMAKPIVPDELIVVIAMMTDRNDSTQ
jgi:CheY-like chemotaxis protein